MAGETGTEDRAAREAKTNRQNYPIWMGGLPKLGDKPIQIRRRFDTLCVPAQSDVARPVEHRAHARPNRGKGIYTGIGGARSHHVRRAAGPPGGSFPENG